VVLGSAAAERLGIGAAGPDVQVCLDGRWFTVVGVLEPVEPVLEPDDSVLVGWEAAERRLGFRGNPTVVCTRVAEDRIEAVRDLLAAAAGPQAPHEVEVSRPSDALAAKAAAERAFTGLLLGLGGVALPVGGLGVANTMVVSVLERRAEIGLRRSLGATRGRIRLQFPAESQLMGGSAASGAWARAPRSPPATRTPGAGPPWCRRGRWPGERRRPC